MNMGNILRTTVIGGLFTQPKKERVTEYHK